MEYLLKNPATVWQLLLQHLSMTSLTLVLSVLIALPLALLISRYRWLNVPFLGILGILYTVPSLALIILLVPFFGLNAWSVIAAMVLYAQVILVRSLVVGLQSIQPAVLEAARGMGMSYWQRWWQIQVPLILPIFLAGLRIATVVTIGIATIGAKFGAGGLGTLLFDGIAQKRDDKIWLGAIVVSLLALAINTAFLGLEWAANPARRIKRSSLQKLNESIQMQ
ncbi:MAG: ABC transporter permease [Leptolyngbya sp. IPPAS B-1204]|uniref:ABC transporter permease n=1 Tax=Leptolyngbya sp. NK1-12 TaxID=2547451 RepID=A0AA96WJC1_9CYAN|nr:ABC transporter permease [Leptolyngbya sp. NK1-12]MBF2050672.1 ABC transporter permease [Elainella sp. C42_A2020_010]RNJ70518.1 MAG: ABC transporter permease [Leptolyngbya sp. IPPAS B-1204]WNZ22421.1 ABC transporter permease [Leptolyngbya sp. NK1-12]